MDVKERIKEYLDYKGISDYRFEKNMSLSKGYINKAKNPTSDVLVKMCGIYTDLSPEWLLTGEGEMIKSDSKMDSVPNDNPVESQDDVVRQRIISLISERNVSVNSLSGGNRALQRKMNRQINEGAAITSETISSILAAFPDISADWLFKCEGATPKTPFEDKANENNSPLELNTINLNDMESLMSMLKEALSDLRKEREYVHKYHEEIVALKNEVEELKVQLSEKDDIINHLRKGEMDYGKAMVN